MVAVITHSDIDRTGEFFGFLLELETSYIHCSTPPSVILSVTPIPSLSNTQTHTRTHKTPQSSRPASQSIGPLRSNTKVLKTQRAARKTAINLYDLSVDWRNAVNLQDSVSQEQHRRAVSCRDSNHCSCEHLAWIHNHHASICMCATSWQTRTQVNTSIHAGKKFWHRNHWLIHYHLQIGVQCHCSNNVDCMCLMNSKKHLHLYHLKPLSNSLFVAGLMHLLFQQRGHVVWGLSCICLNRGEIGL